MRMSAHFWNSSKSVTNVLVLTTSAQVAPATFRHRSRFWSPKFTAPADKRPLLPRSRSHTAKTPRPDRLAKAFHGQCTCFGAVEPVGEGAVCLLRYEDFASCGGVGEPRCEVRRITSHGVFAVSRTSCPAGDDLAASDADMDPDRRPTRADIS